MLDFIGYIAALFVGLSCFKEKILRYRPLYKFWIDLLDPFQHYVGVVSFFYGLLTIFRTWLHIKKIFHEPFVFLLTLALGWVSLFLGLYFGRSLILPKIQEKLSQEQLASIEKLYEQIERNLEFLGSLAIGLSLLHWASKTANFLAQSF